MKQLYGWEKELMARVLEIYNEELANKGCDDSPKNWRALIPDPVDIEEKYHNWNGDPEEIDIQNPTAHESAGCIVSYLIGRLKGEIE